MAKVVKAFTDHDQAWCWNCWGDFGPGGWPFKTGNPPGHGEFMQSCCKCNHWTHYDISRPTTS